MTSLAEIDLATGVVFGATRGRPRLHAAGTPVEAFESALRPALRRGPTYVSFSGGRDSSAVLAVAAQLARREGYDDPVPITIRAGSAPHSHESDWQENVIRHVGSSEWIRIEVEDELDAIGPYAQRVLERHGVLWPFNVHFHVPMLEHAAGGTLFTGVGGDELWIASRSVHEGPRRRLLRLAPLPVRRALLARREPIDFEWLRPEGTRLARRIAGGQTASQPWRLLARMRYQRSLRSTATGLAALDLVAADAGATIAHPLYDAGVWGSVAAVAPPGGFPDREAALRTVAGHVLPEALIARRTKAAFNEVFFRSHGRAFAERWSGAGVPDELVDAVALREHWLNTEIPDAHTFSLLQSAWLASAGDRLEQPLGRGVE